MQNKELLRRILFIILAVPIVMFVIFYPVKYNILIFMLVLFLIIASSYEYSLCLKSKELNINFYLFIFQSLLISFSFFLFSHLFLSFEFLFFILVFIILLSSFFYIFKKNIASNSLTLFLHLFGLFYIPISSSLILIFYTKIPDASSLLLLFLLIVWSSNIFGYLLGLFWLPRNPLNLEVSPNKSIKGFIGALFFGTLIPFLLYLLLPDFFHIKVNIKFLSDKIFVLILILFTNIFSIMGDLFESAFKRFCGVKDSSNYLKGFGGILDSIDSILFAFPFYFSILLLLYK